MFFRFRLGDAHYIVERIFVVICDHRAHRFLRKQRIVFTGQVDEIELTQLAHFVDCVQQHGPITIRDAL